MQRRTFLWSTTTSVLAAGLARTVRGLPAKHPFMESIGLQLWTVRNQLEKDVPSTMRSVADAGYKQVELMRVLDADKFVPAARDAGLRVTSAFIDWQSIGNPDSGPNFDDILAKAQQLGLKYLVFGYIGKGHRETVEHFQRHAEQANRAGEKCQQAGLQLCYHNHSFEFAKLAGGRAGWDVLVDEFDHKLVQFEVDIFWVAIGGRDPIDAMQKLAGRVCQVHLKDMKRGASIQHDEGQVPHEDFKELGNGELDIPAAVRVAREVGAQQCHVEQDQSPDPIDSIAQSMTHLQQL